MKGDASYFRIGLFIIAGFLMLAVALVVFGVGQFFRPNIFVETYVDGTVQGIDVGSAVKFRGVTVGRVSRVSFLFTEYPQVDRMVTANFVVVLMQIESEIFPDMFQVEDLTPILDRNIQRGMRVKIEPQGITGLNFMEIDYLESSRTPPLAVTWHPVHYYLPSAPGELTNLLDSVNDIMRRIRDLNLNGISDGAVELLDNLNKAVTGAKIAELSESAQKLFDRFSTAMDDAKIPELSADSRKLVTDLSRAVEELEIEKLSADTRQLLTEVRRSNEELKTILGNLEPASRINGDDVAATLANLRLISENLRAASADLSRDPSRLIFSRPPAPASVMDPPNRKP